MIYLNFVCAVAAALAYEVYRRRKAAREENPKCGHVVGFVSEQICARCARDTAVYVACCMLVTAALCRGQERVGVCSVPPSSVRAYSAHAALCSLTWCTSVHAHWTHTVLMAMLPHNSRACVNH